MKTYTIIKVSDSMYIDKGGKPVQGYLVTFDYNKRNSRHSVNVPSLDKKVVDDKIKNMVLQLDALFSLQE